MKKQLRQLLQARDHEEIARLAVEKKRTLALLLSLTYDRDPLICWRAIEATGVSTQRLANDDPDRVRDHLRRIYWLLSEESGGICWRGPETMAEIVSRTPNPYRDYVPIVVSLLLEMADEDLEHFRAGILWAIGRLASVVGSELDAVLPTIEDCLEHPDSQVRGMAVWCLGQCGHGERIAGREDLLEDATPVTVYDEGQLVRLTVGNLAQRSAQRVS